MNDAQHHIAITVFGKTCRFACPPHEERQLLAAADHINQWVDQQVGEADLSSENIATMVALNMANQLLESQKNQQRIQTTSERIKQVLGRIDEQSAVAKIGADL